MNFKKVLEVEGIVALVAVAAIAYGAYWLVTTVDDIVDQAETSIENAPANAWAAIKSWF